MKNKKSGKRTRRRKVPSQKRFSVHALECPNPMPKRYKTNTKKKFGREIPLIDGLYVHSIMNDRKADEMNNMCIDIFHTLIKKQNNTMSIRSEEHESKRKKKIKNNTHSIFFLPTRLGLYAYLAALKQALIDDTPKEAEKWNRYITKIESMIFDTIIPTLFPSISNPRTAEIVEKNTNIALLYYKSKHNLGLKQHLDRPVEHPGPVSVISFANSILDYIPFQELRDIGLKPLRLVYKSGSLVTMDGTPRYFYMHGVPTNIKFEKPIRCAIVLQFDDIGIKGTNCSHTELLKDWFYTCLSNMK